MIDFSRLDDLTLEDMIYEGCAPWHLNDGSTVMLFPLYEYENIPVGTQLHTMNNKQITFTSDTNNDSRFGFLGYGKLFPNNGMFSKT